MSFLRWRQVQRKRFSPPLKKKRKDLFLLLKKKFSNNTSSSSNHVNLNQIIFNPRESNIFPVTSLMHTLSIHPNSSIQLFRFLSQKYSNSKKVQKVKKRVNQRKRKRRWKRARRRYLQVRKIH